MEDKLPTLGFPEEQWDSDGDLFCRPLPNTWAFVFRAGNGDMFVDFFAYRKGQRPEDVWMSADHGPAPIRVDGVLHAHGVIQNLINSDPPKQETSHGEDHQEALTP